MIRSLWGPNATEDDCAGRLKVSYRRLPKGELIGSITKAASKKPTHCHVPQQLSQRQLTHSIPAHPWSCAGERAVFQPRSATFQQEVGEDIRAVLEAALLQASPGRAVAAAAAAYQGCARVGLAVDSVHMPCGVHFCCMGRVSI